MRRSGDERGARVVEFRRHGPGRPRSASAPAAESPAAARERTLRRVTRLILAVGFGAALGAWIVAQARPENPLGYDPLDTKKYVHDLRVYGGTANVLAAEFREWFAGLWYGRNLAYTIAVLTILVVLVVRFYLLTNPESDEEHGHHSSGPSSAGG